MITERSQKIKKLLIDHVKLHVWLSQMLILDMSLSKACITSTARCTDQLFLVGDSK